MSAVALRRFVTGAGERPAWLPIWSVPAAMRAVRATLVMPVLFAVTLELIGNLQMATFAAFGSFATLVLVGFEGSRLEKLRAHAVLALAGSVLVVIGTAVSASTLVAVIVTVPVTFAVFFSAVAGPNAAAGVTGALLTYVLPAASPGTMSMVPDRLFGWWLASVVGTAAVIVLSPPPTEARLRGAVARTAEHLASALEAALAGTATEATLEACLEARHELVARFIETPYRPVGLLGRDEALANAVELLQWCGSLLADTVREHPGLRGACGADRELLAASAAVLRDAGRLFAGADASPQLERLEAARRRNLAAAGELEPDGDGFGTKARLAFHAHTVAVAVLAIGADALVAGGVVTGHELDVARSQGFGNRSISGLATRRFARTFRLAGIAAWNATLRSVWFVNSLRGALALAAAVAVADLSSVQHGFWVVLGTLSVLRTRAAATGATALRALLGTAAGFLIGGVLLVVIGAGSGALWVALPIAVLVAAYAPGTAPFAVGQAAFTVTVAVLFNLLAPVGWKVGVLRIEDVALGCLVSVVVGLLFWPRGVAPVVGDDLADAFRAGAAYLHEAVDWVCGFRTRAPQSGVVALTTGRRLDEALRAFLAEQGTKHISKQELWRLVGGSLRLRLTAMAVAELPRDEDQGSLVAQAILGRRAARLEGWYGQLADELARRRANGGTALGAPSFAEEAIDGAARSPSTIWLAEYLDHLVEPLPDLTAPAVHVAEIRRRSWWR